MSFENFPESIKENIKLAEFAGWQLLEEPKGGILLPYQVVGYPPIAFIVGKKEHIPDFSTLDELRKVECALFGGQVQAYYDLIKSMRPDLVKDSDKTLAVLFADAKMKRAALLEIISRKELTE